MWTPSPVVRDTRSTRPTAPGPAHGRIAEAIGTGALLALAMAWPRAGPLLCRGASCADVRVGPTLWGLAADLSYVAAITVVCILALLIAAPRPGAVRGILGAFRMVAGISVVAAFANPIALRELGHPLTYQWLYYSDFLLSLDAYNTLNGLLSWTLILQMGAAAAAVVLGGPRAGRWVDRQGTGWWNRRGAIAASLVTLPALLVTTWLHGASHPPRAESATPVVFFLQSTLGGGAQTLGSLQTDIRPDDVLAVSERPAERSLHAASRAPRAPPLTNVLVLVLESVGSQSVGLYGAVPSLTPQLDSYREHARIYARAYAHVPSTMHTLVSLLTSAYHPHSFRILTREAPEVALPAISEALRRRGYRTAFFNSADNRFQRGSAFLEHHGFDTLVDHRRIPCAGGKLKASQKGWPHLDGVYDRCTAAALLDWIGKTRSAPFFAVLWTMQTHYPYFAAEERAFAPARRINRYMSGLYESDQAIGELLRSLAASGVLDSTLVVVLGDHGEGLGKHEHLIHSTLYEEDVRVPLLLINRSLFHGEVDSAALGMVDVAPTIMDVLGLPPEPTWQGRSGFDPDRSARIYLFAPFSGVTFGLVEGSRKFIYKADAGTWELYDLKTDPGELTNLAPEVAEPTEQLGRLAAWYQYQRRYYRRALATDGD
jgi:lipoteichoic acid synthase